MFEAWEAARVPGFSEEVAGAAGQVPGDGPNGAAEPHSDVDRALLAAESAARAEPRWAVPQRFIDDWRHRPWLTLPARYGEHLEAARRGSAVGAYLAARLGGADADRRMDQARRLDPLLSWAWHGEAWRSFGRGRIRQAIAAGSQALRYARDPGERAHFTWALGRYLRADERDGQARRVLERSLVVDEAGPAVSLRAAERTFIELELALAELESVEDAAVRRGVQRGLAILRRPGIPIPDRVGLALALSGVEDALVVPDEITLALLEAERGASSEVETEALRDLRGRGVEPGAEGGRPAGSRRERLLGAIESGIDARAAMAEWAAGLPSWLLDEDGAPRRPVLKRLVSLALSSGPDAGALEQEQLGDALIDAGWFREAKAFSKWIRDPVVSARIEESAVRGRAVLGSLRALASRLDARAAFLKSGAVAADGIASLEKGRITTLGALREEIEGRFVAAGALDKVTEQHPKIAYGPLGAILHPGPRFSAEDEALGRGSQGEIVPGISKLFSTMGRFALIGNGVGQGGPDATVLRIVGVEERSGSHLGRPFRGTVFWCEGADVPGRFGRMGAAISGAALHEGYYVDLEMVAVEKAQWDELRTRFLGRPDRVDAALSVRGAKVPVRQRTETTPPLGAADRMRLAVMRGDAGTRGSSGLPRGTGEDLREISLGELAHVVATHEEGHLCDRGQWYPLSIGRVMKLISLAAAHRFQAGAIARALEERAQLVALAASDDVRVAWIDILDAAEASGGGVTPHGGAYRRVLQDLVNRLDQEWRRGEWAGSDLDPERRWIDQLHRVDPERLRALAVREAKSRGLSG